jgi:hypothetical protein
MALSLATATEHPAGDVIFPEGTAHCAVTPHAPRTENIARTTAWSLFSSRSWFRDQRTPRRGRSGRALLLHDACKDSVVRIRSERMHARQAGQVILTTSTLVAENSSTMPTSAQRHYPDYARAQPRWAAWYRGAGGGGGGAGGEGEGMGTAYESGRQLLSRLQLRSRSLLSSDKCLHLA